MLHRLLIFTVIATLLVLLFQFFGWLKAPLFVGILGTGLLSVTLSAIVSAILVGATLYLFIIVGPKLYAHLPFSSNIVLTMHILFAGMAGVWLVTLIPLVLTRSGNILTLFVEGIVFNILVLLIYTPPTPKAEAVMSKSTVGQETQTTWSIGQT